MSGVAETLKAAKRHGIVKFVGDKCAICAGVVRYTSSRSCVECVKQKHIERKAK